jgi:histidinol-phosphate/aromatic aminotransferase/cobyric acid decarboxylase-like protein
VRAAVGGAWGVAPEEVACGNGCGELIAAAALALLGPGAVALMPATTYGEYRRAARIAGAAVVEVLAAEDGAVPTDALLDAIVARHPTMVWLAAPNTPTGERLELELLARAADLCERVGAVLALDQSFDAFLERPLGTPALRGHPAVLHLRSLTKDHALAGLRLGVAIGPAPVIARLERVRAPWTVSAPAQVAGAAAFGADVLRHTTESIVRVRAEARRMRERLTAGGARVLDSATHFFCVDAGPFGGAAASARLAAHHGVLVRDCTSFGLPRWIRIAAQRPPQNHRIVRAVLDVLRPAHPGPPFSEQIR